MRTFDRFLLTAILIAAGSGVTGAWAQNGGQNRDWDRDGDRDRNGTWNDNNNNTRSNARWNNQAYQEGYQRGLFDARQNHGIQYRFNRWKNDFDRRSYVAGYDSAYWQERNSGGANRGGANNGRSGVPNGGNRSGDYGRPGTIAAGMQNARQIGAQDGLNDGAKDRQTGHSFRPTQGDNYKNATRGYASSYGSKDQYKQWYREAYSEAYQRGYYGNGGYRNGFLR